MRKNISKLLVFCMMLTLMISATSASALTCVYGKTYSSSKQGSICTMVAKGDSDVAYTKATNNRAVAKYVTVEATRRKADTNAIVEKDISSQVIGSGKSVTKVVTRYWKYKNNEYRHFVETWDCSYQPSGSGWELYHKDELKYVVTQQS